MSMTTIVECQDLAPSADSTLSAIVVASFAVCRLHFVGHRLAGLAVAGLAEGQERGWEVLGEGSQQREWEGEVEVEALGEDELFFPNTLSSKASSRSNGRSCWAVRDRRSVNGVSSLGDEGWDVVVRGARWVSSNGGGGGVVRNGATAGGMAVAGGKARLGAVGEGVGGGVGRGGGGTAGSVHGSTM
ncbi:unnamed protein product [Closterium sp. NIES-54]